MIIDRSESQREIDTQIDRLDGEFQKNASAAESHELERAAFQNSGDWGEMLPGHEYMDSHPIPKGVCGVRKKRGTTTEKRKQKKRNESLEVELGLSGGFPMGNMQK